MIKSYQYHSSSSSTVVWNRSIRYWSCWVSTAERERLEMGIGVALEENYKSLKILKFSRFLIIVTTTITTT